MCLENKEYYKIVSFDVDLIKPNAFYCYSMFRHSCDNVAVSDFLNFDISGRRLRLHGISAMAQQQEWFTPAVFRTFPNLVDEK